MTAEIAKIKRDEKTERFLLRRLSKGRYRIEHDLLDPDLGFWTAYKKYGPFNNREAARQFMLDRKFAPPPTNESEKS